LVVHFSNGAFREGVVSDRISPEGRNNVIDLPGERRLLESVELWYYKEPWGCNPRVSLYGIPSGDTGGESIARDRYIRESACVWLERRLPLARVCCLQKLIRNSTVYVLTRVSRIIFLPSTVGLVRLLRQVSSFLRVRFLLTCWPEGQAILLLGLIIR